MKKGSREGRNYSGVGCPPSCLHQSRNKDLLLSWLSVGSPVVSKEHIYIGMHEKFFSGQGCSSAHQRNASLAIVEERHRRQVCIGEVAAEPAVHILQKHMTNIRKVMKH